MTKKEGTSAYYWLIILAAFYICQGQDDQVNIPLNITTLLNMPFTQYVNYYGYPVQTHKITTQDGYILTYYRIQNKGSSFDQIKPVAYFQHGLIDSSDSQVSNDEQLAPGFILANQGFDVWFGNSRGNKYSKEAVNMTTKDKEFWQFSWQHISKFDLPAAFAYIGQITGQRVNYIGHSQGTTIMMAALSQNDPTILKYLGHVVLLAPVAFIHYSNSTLLSLMAKTNAIKFLQNLGVKSFMEPNWLTEELQGIVCKEIVWICSQIFELVASKNDELDNLDRFSVIMGHYPSGSSMMDMEHWMQMKKLPPKQLQMYDYGNTELNMQHYGQSTPPFYNISDITYPLNIFEGTYDTLADIQDATDLKDELIHSQVNFVVLDKFDHGTFLWGKNMDWFQQVVEILNSEMPIPQAKEELY